MAVPPLLIIAANPKLTLAALHHACADARTSGAEVDIAQFVTLANPALLGDPNVYTAPTLAQQFQLDDYAATAEDYGVSAHLYAMQTVDTRAAIIELAEMLTPRAVYVQAAKFGPVWWRHWRQNRLETALKALGSRVIWVDAAFLVTRPPAPQKSPAPVTA